MASTRTLDELVAEVRQRADIENDPHITDDEVTRYINVAAKRLHRLIVDTSPLDFAVSSSFTTTNNQGTYSIPTITPYPSSSFYKLVHMEANIQGYWRSLEQWTFEKKTLYRNSSTWGLTGQPISYGLTANDTLEFAPVPDGGYPIIATWVPAFTNLVSGSDIYDGRDGFEEFVVLDACVKVCQKQETSSTLFVSEREEVLSELKTQYATKDLDHPPRVRDTASSYNGIWPWQVR